MKRPTICTALLDFEVADHGSAARTVRGYALIQPVEKFCSRVCLRQPVAHHWPQGNCQALTNALALIGQIRQVTLDVDRNASTELVTIHRESLPEWDRSARRSASVLAPAAPLEPKSDPRAKAFPKASDKTRAVPTPPWPWDFEWVDLEEAARFADVRAKIARRLEQDRAAANSDQDGEPAEDIDRYVED